MSWSKVKHSNVIHCLNAEGTQHYAMYLYTDIKIKYFATKIDARNNKAHKRTSLLKASTILLHRSRLCCSITTRNSAVAEWPRVTLHWRL